MTNLTVKEKESPRTRSPFRCDLLKVLQPAKREYIVRNSVVACREESIVFKIIGCPGSKFQFARENDHRQHTSPVTLTASIHAIEIWSISDGMKRLRSGSRVIIHLSPPLSILNPVSPVFRCRNPANEVNKRQNGRWAHMYPMLFRDPLKSSQYRWPAGSYDTALFSSRAFCFTVKHSG